MQHKLFLIASAFSIFSATALHAQTMSGSGAKLCSDFNQAVQLNSDVAINGYISWAQGYISGFNATNAQGKDVTIDPAGLNYWLSNYCSTQPDINYYQAVVQLISAQAR